MSDSGAPGAAVAAVQPLYVYGPVRVSGRSTLASEFVQLSPRQRETLGLTDSVIIFVDAVIAVARLMIDDADSRSLSERLQDIDGLLPELDEARIEGLMEGLIQLGENDTPAFRRLKSDNFLQFVQRLVGAAKYARLEAAGRADGAVVLVALRRALRHLLPMAVALDDCLAVLSPEQIASVEGLTEMGHSILNMAISVDGFFDKAIDVGIPLHAVTTRPAEVSPLGTDLETIAVGLHDILEGFARESLTELSERLARKIQGARDALEMSADGVSQSASSLIEFIDRLMRDAFAPDDVIAWVHSERPGDTDLVYERYGALVPTKRAQALCFIHAGQKIEHSNTFNELAALGLVAARNQLQQLKHADAGTPDEVGKLRSLMSAVEGFFAYAVRVGWAIASDEAVDALRDRLRS